MKRYKLTLRFDGRDFGGWQIQENTLTVQEVMQKALSTLTEEPIQVYGCSRTDSGVHALQFIAHFDTRSTIAPKGILAGVNSMLNKNVAITDIQEVHPEFDSRRDALCKTYRYEIFNRKIRDPFREGRAWHILVPLHISAMKEAAKGLIGEHDFSCFQAADSEPRPSVRTLTECSVTSKPIEGGGEEVFIQVESKGFLKYMVRNIVGTLVEVGKGRRSSDSIAQLIASCNRNLAGPTAPSHGLYLVEVIYA